MDKMIDKINSYYRIYKFDFGKGVHGRIANNKGLKKIFGEIYGHLLVRETSGSLILMERDFNNRKEIIKIHSIEPEAVQSELERITGMEFSQYQVD